MTLAIWYEKLAANFYKRVSTTCSIVQEDFRYVFHVIKKLFEDAKAKGFAKMNFDLEKRLFRTQTHNNINLFVWSIWGKNDPFRLYDLYEWVYMDDPKSQNPNLIKWSWHFDSKN